MGAMFAVSAVTQVIKKKKDPESYKSLQIDSTFICFCTAFLFVCF